MTPTSGWSTSVGADLLAAAGQERQHPVAAGPPPRRPRRVGGDRRRLLGRLEAPRRCRSTRAAVDHAGRDGEREVPGGDHDADALRLVGSELSSPGRRLDRRRRRRGGASGGRSTRRSRSPRTRRRRPRPSGLPASSTSSAASSKRRWPHPLGGAGTAPPPARAAGVRRHRRPGAPAAATAPVGLGRPAGGGHGDDLLGVGPGRPRRSSAGGSTRRPPITPGTSIDRAAAEPTLRPRPPAPPGTSGAAPLGERLGPVGAGLGGSVGAAAPARSAGSRRRPRVGRRRRRPASSRSCPSAKRWRTKLSLEVFSSSRRTR